MSALKTAAHILLFEDFKKLAKDERGQVMVITAALSLALILAWGAVFNLGEAVGERMRMQDAADAAAYSGAVWGARMMNFLAYTNRTLIAHFVTMSQLVVLHSNAKELYSLAWMGQWIPYVGFIFKAIKTVIGIYEKILRYAVWIGVRFLDSGIEGSGYLSLNNLILGAQKMLPIMLLPAGFTKIFNVDIGGINSAQQKLVDDMAGKDKIRINPINLFGGRASWENAVGGAMEILTLKSYLDLVKLPRPFEMGTGGEVEKSAFNTKTKQWQRIQKIIIDSYRPKPKNFFFGYSERGNWIPFILEFNLLVIRARWIESTEIKHYELYASDEYKVEIFTFLFGWKTIFDYKEGCGGISFFRRPLYNSKNSSKVYGPALDGAPSLTCYYRGLHGIENEEYKLFGSGNSFLSKLGWIAGIYEIKTERDKDNPLLKGKPYNYVPSLRKATHYVVAFKDAKDTIIRKILKLDKNDSEYWNMLWENKFFTVATANVFYERPGKTTESPNLMNPFWSARLVSVDKSLDDLFSSIPGISQLLKLITIIPH